MGLTEAEAVGKMWSGVKAMIQVGQPANVATDASSERVMKQKNCKQFLDCPLTYIFEQALYSCCLSIILASLLTPALMYLLVQMLFVFFGATALSLTLHMTDGERPGKGGRGEGA